MHNILKFALLAAAVSAHPAYEKEGPSKSTKTTKAAEPSKTSAPTCKNSASQNANFDDLTGLPAVELNPIPVPYKGLDFQGFQFLEIVPTALLPGVVPHSGVQYAFSNALTTSTGGSPEWTANYAGSTIKSFTPSSFYYGCAINGLQGATALPTACNIAITGYKAGDNTASAQQVAAQSFSYNPTTTLGVAQMTPGTFNSDFKEVQYVLIQYTLPGGSALLQTDLALLIDDVQYTTCTSDDK